MPTLREIINAYIQIEAKKEPSNEKFNELQKLFWGENRYSLASNKARIDFDLNITKSKTEEVTNELEASILDSISKFPGAKINPVKIYQEFARYYGEHILPMKNLLKRMKSMATENRENDILKLSYEDKNLAQIADELGVTERTIRNDVERLLNDGMAFFGGRYKLSGTTLNQSCLSFESTINPLALVINRMQVIILLESLRTSPFNNLQNIGDELARSIWMQIIPKFRSQIVETLRQDGFKSKEAIAWYEKLENEAFGPDRLELKFVTETEMVKGNIPEQLIHALKEGRFVSIEYLNQTGESESLTEVRVFGFGDQTFKFKTNDEAVLELEVKNIISVT